MSRKAKLPSGRDPYSKKEDDGVDLSSSMRSTSKTVFALPSSPDESACSNRGLHSSLLSSLVGVVVGSAYKEK